MASTQAPLASGNAQSTATTMTLKDMLIKDDVGRPSGKLANGTGPAYESSATEADLLSRYEFPTSKLKKTLDDSTKMPLILVACGSFSPPTILHMRMFEMAADFVRRNTKFELVGQFISPVGDAYMKKGLAKAAHRISMCGLACRSSERVMVDPWEAYHETYVRTALVLKHFEDEINVVRGGIPTKDGGRRQCRVALLAGADLMGTMSTPGVWTQEDLDLILGKYGVYVIERSGTDVEEELSKLSQWRDNIIAIEQLVKNDVSSTIIRSFLRRDLSVRYLIPADVLSYVDEHGLYNEDGIRPHSRSRSLEISEEESSPV